MNSGAIGPLAPVVRHLQQAGWRRHAGPPRQPLAGRVQGFPDLHGFAQHVRRLVAPGEQVWFLGSEDYLDDGGEGWDFLERQVSLPCAEGDAVWTAQGQAFWSAHLPFALSVRDDYAYLAVDRAGRVWAGRAPELESPWPVADNLAAFAQRFLAEAEAGAGELHGDWIDDA